jgi:hypothetical protein
MLLAGIALGPLGLGLLPAPVLNALAPAVSIALVTTGVLIGVELDWRRIRLALGRGSIIPAIAAVTATTGATFVLSRVSPSLGLGIGLAVLLAISAAFSSSPEDETDEGDELVTPSYLHGTLPLLLLGGLALLWRSTGSVDKLGWLAVSLAGLTLATAVAGWLLVSGTRSDSEPRVYTIGVLVLLAGIADTLKAPALLTGLIAGSLWTHSDALSRTDLTRDIRRMQRPIVALLLVIAGAQLSPVAGLALAAVLVIAGRTLGTLGGRWLTAGDQRQNGRWRGGLHLVSPGFFGIAFTLDVARTGAVAGATPAFIAIAVVVAILSDAIVLLTARVEARA